MSRKLIYSIILVAVLMGVFGLAFRAQRVEASGTIYILATGEVVGTDKISRFGDAWYEFNDNINDSIVVQRSNIVIDGDGFTLDGLDFTIWEGLNLTGVSNVTIININIERFASYSIYLKSASQCVISRNNITANADMGIRLDSSSDSTISENNISENKYGVYLWYSSNITVSGNNITGNSPYGMYLDSSSDNTILSNTFSSNPMAGISLMNSSDNAIRKNMDFSDSSQGVVLWGESHRNIVSENILSPSDLGIAMGYSDANRILNNTVSHTDVSGIQIQQICSHSIIANNMVSENILYGISIESENKETRYNAILDNNVIHNLIGIYIDRLSGNVVYHNNFVDNTNQSSISNSTNIWDDGFEGNYWSNYTGVDSNRDGIGDSWHNITQNNTDHYPLMGPFHSFNTTLGKYVNVISNSTINSFRYFASNSTIIMHVSNVTASQTRGFCRISIPYEVMSEPFNVTIDGANPTYWNYTLYDNGTHRWIYFEYEHTTREIVIIPEFPLFLILPLFMIATLLAVIVYKKKNTPENQHARASNLFDQRSV
jgi:parallel beta-helix repeat protein